MAFEPEVYTEQYVTYSFLWHSMNDACVKCRSLNGEIFEDQDIFQKMLFSPIWGDLMDLDTGYLFTHPNCRCQVEVLARVNLREVNELEEYQRFLEMMH
jgi:hypothetical protein